MEDSITVHAWHMSFNTTGSSAFMKPPSFILIVNRSPQMLFIDVELTSFFYLPIRSLGLRVSKTVMENMESSFAVDTNINAVTAPY